MISPPKAGFDGPLVVFAFDPTSPHDRAGPFTPALVWSGVFEDRSRKFTPGPPGNCEVTEVVQSSDAEMRALF